MLRFGTVTQQDHDKGLYRVNFPADNLVSYWLSPVHLVTRSAKVFAPLSIGEHVACFMDNDGVDGVILGAIYSTKDVPQGTANKTFLDFGGSVSVTWNSSTDTLTVKNNSVEVEVTETKVTLKKGADSLGAVLSDLIDAMALETHISAAPGSPTTPPVNAAAYTAIKTRLNLFLG